MLLGARTARSELAFGTTTARTIFSGGGKGLRVSSVQHTSNCIKLEKLSRGRIKLNPPSDG